MTRHHTTIAHAVALASIIAFAGATARADTFHSDFATGFDGWQQQWHKDDPGGSDGMVSHTTERGYLDAASLEFDMGDGFGDDGTLWIEKQFAVPAGVPSPVSLSFYLFNEFQSDFNTFEVKAAISTDNPNQQADFTTIGNTDSAEGWVPFTYDQTVTSPTGQVWVAAGIRVAWETPRVYWIDHVEVTTPVIPEPASAILILVGLAVSVVAHRPVRRRRMNDGPRTTGRAPSCSPCSPPPCEHLASVIWE